ncbi:hypothetical protein D0859_02634 [Hortaea werneckii]|uniref:Clavaminate synthase-like protein n=1 Tax=Hortaea werneckii TaxID=91943 RepID=A0A3M7J667_HORWE|nr:hypothetical protein D0859_02634 [Hortaea werneckii]
MRPAQEDSMRPQAISVSLSELQNSSVSLETLEEAFGPASLGIIIVRDLPEKFLDLRKRLLSYSSYLANLPADELDRVEKAEAKYNVGWSCGKETLADGRYDTLKGSYYAQPIHNSELEEKARKLYPNVPEMTSKNVWPREEVLPGFETLFEELCHLIVDTAALVAKNCDRYGMAKLDGYKDGTLENIVRTSVSTKARLLHYFPPPPTTEETTRPDSAMALDDDWCATHLDLGALTGLTSQMFVEEDVHPPHAKPDESGLLPALPEMDSHPDPTAGLWIKDRSGRKTLVDIPRDCLAFQTGQALQSITRGKFKAVPHYQRHKELTLSPQYDNATYASSYGGQVKIQVKVPTRSKLDAISKTFNTVELLESIITCFPAAEIILRTQLICKGFRNAIHEVPSIQGKLFHNITGHYTETLRLPLRIRGLQIEPHTETEPRFEIFGTLKPDVVQGLQRFTELRDTYATSPATQTFMLRQACLEPVQKWFWRVQRASEGTPIIRVASGIKLKHILAAVQTFKGLNRWDCQFAGCTVSKLDLHEVQIEVSAEWEVLQQNSQAQSGWQGRFLCASRALEGSSDMTGWQQELKRQWMGYGD